MTLPSTIPDGSVIIRGPIGGPFQIGSGIFVVARGASAVKVYKAINDNPEDGWAEQDSSNAPTADASCYHAVEKGDKIHIATQWSWTARKEGADVYYHVFNPASGWETTDDLVTKEPNGKTFVSIVARSTDFVIAYEGKTEKIMGQEYARCSLAYGTAGSWDADIDCGGSGQNRYGNPFVAVDGGNRAHIFFSKGNTNDFVFSTFKPDNTFSHQATLITTDGNIDDLGYSRAIAFDGKVRFMYLNTQDKAQTAGFDYADIPTISSTATDIFGPENINFAFGHTGSVQYVLYRSGDDIKYKETGSGNDTWGAEQAELPGGAAVTSAPINRGAGDVIGYLLMPGPGAAYNER